MKVDPSSRDPRGSAESISHGMWSALPCRSRLNGSLIAVLLLCAATLQAHPVPREYYDRTIVVRLTRPAVIVDYSLQIDDWTVYRDIAALDREELGRLTNPKEVYDLFARRYAPVLADNLIAKLDGRELAFRCVKRSVDVTDHVRVNFSFQADWQLPEGDGELAFSFREGNYLENRGRIDLSLGSDLILLNKSEPDPLLKKVTLIEMRPGESERLRRASAKFQNYLDLELGPMPRVLGEEPAAPAATRSIHRQLRDLLFETDTGLALLLIMAALYGGVHALTPGHGKTMVAAYLVGQHGTVWHALLLGLVTTLTHTGAVLLMAGLYLLVPSEAVTRNVQILLGFLGGLMATTLGLVLFYRWLTNQPDHFHIGGHHHHHDHDHEGHDHADHYHDEHGHAHPVSTAYTGPWGLIVLGISGGIVPCGGAILLFVAGVYHGQPWLTLGLVLAFSAGLAAVLVLIGILVVTVKGFATSRFGTGRLTRLLPLLSALCITGVGIWLCYDSLHPEPEESPAAVGRP